MKRSYELAEAVLQGLMAPKEGLNKMEEMRKDPQAGVEFRSRSSCLIRLFYALLKQEQGQDVAVDIASHLRQFILMYGRKVVIRSELASGLSRVLERFGLVIQADGEIDVEEGYPLWIGDTRAVTEAYELKVRKQRVPAVGDGILHKMTGFTHYQSHAQKQLVHAAMSMQPGDTLTICLPTGGGKSLVGLFPAFFDTQGGTLKGGIIASAGTTIVIVPTTGLAIDQKNAASKYFSLKVEEKYRPQAYRSEMPQAEKDIIFEGIKEGTVPILFTSPESLVIGPLGQVILESAGRGHVNRFVIDEAHIIIDWGNHFRTGFQLLSAYQKQLLARSNGKLKTLLMSATLTPWTSKVLKELFSEEGAYTEIRCDALRYEPAYLVDHSENEQVRNGKIRSGIGFLPRPLILYVNKKDHAKEWVELLKAAGYSSVGMFTGDTDDKERRFLLKEWNEDRIDIMVATSAFGMGVDKPDIRTIIHCGIPESLNRYYQEVGRGGRDGFASLSILSAVNDDVDVVHSLIDGQILTTELLVARWSALYEIAERGDQADELWLDMTVQPDHLKHTISGKQNANWNVASVLLMVRSGLLELLEFERAPEDSPYVPYIKVRILVHGILNDATTMLSYVNPDRDRERERITKEIQTMKYYVFHPKESCLSEYLVETYPYSEAVCGGCPYCQENQKDLRFNVSHIEFPFRSSQPMEVEKMGTILSPYFIGGFRHLIMDTKMQKLQDVSVLTKLLEALIRTNVRTIVLPPLDRDVVATIVKQAPNERINKFYMLLQHDELQQQYTKQVRGPIAVLYPFDASRANAYYVWANQIASKSPENKLIHVVDPQMMIAHEGRAIRDSLDHLSLSLDTFLDGHQQQQTISLF